MTLGGGFDSYLRMSSRRLIALMAAAGLCVRIAALGQVQYSSPGVMGSSAFDWNDLKATTNDHGLFIRVFTTRTATFKNPECVPPDWSRAGRRMIRIIIRRRKLWSSARGRVRR